MMNNTVASATTYTIHLTDGSGFNYYDVVVIHEIVVVSDSYNVITDMGDMWLEINSSYRRCDEDGVLQYLEYRGNKFTVYVERI